MLEVIYLKYFVWHDWVTPTSGIILGSFAALIVWLYGSYYDAGTKN